MAKKIQVDLYNNKRNSSKLYFIFVIFALMVILFISINYDVFSSEKIDNQDNLKYRVVIPEDCTFTKAYDVKRIQVIVDNDYGPGDIYSKPIAKSQYKIEINKSGDIFNVNYKYNGDISRYECDEDWYSITLSDGSEGFIYGGYKSMYINVIE